MKKKILALILMALLLLTLALPLTSCGEPVTKFYLYNWGEYMPLGADDSENVLKLFEAYYEQEYGQKIEVVYSIFASNEDMYAKLKSGSSKIDLVIPSDYMIERLIVEDRLSPLNYDNIAHYSNISAEFLTPDYDLEGRYTVPYTYGLVGLIYNETKVNPADFPEDGNVSWRVLWDEDYTGEILTFNNSRDAFGIPQYILSAENGATSAADNYVNTTDHSRWDAALEMLQAQKPLVQAYVMDEVFNKMENNAAAMAPYYVGDYLTMKAENDALKFVYPTEGTNIFVDAFCVPKGAQNQEISERFIDFVLMTDAEIDGETYNIAKEIAEYICYATPNKEVTNDPDYREFLGEDYDLLYPELTGYNLYYFHNLDPETLEYTNALWERVKVESSSQVWIYVVAGVIVLGLIGGGVLLFLQKKKREKFY